MVAHDKTRRQSDENDRVAILQELTVALSHTGKGETV